MLLAFTLLALLPLFLLAALPSLLSDHIAVGPVVLFPRKCAMYGAMNIHTRWGFICLRLPTVSYGRWLPGYLYVSPNATPWAARWGMGRGFSERDRQGVALRRAARRLLLDVVHQFGHDELEAAARIRSHRQDLVITIPAIHAEDPVEYVL